MNKQTNMQENHPLKEEINHIINAGKNIGKMYKQAGEETAEEYKKATNSVTKKFTDII